MFVSKDRNEGKQYFGIIEAGLCFRFRFVFPLFYTIEMKAECVSGITGQTGFTVFGLSDLCFKN